MARKAQLAQDGAQDEGPQQIFCRDLMTATPIAGGAEVGRQMEVLADELPQPTWGRASQSRFLFSCAPGGPRLTAGRWPPALRALRLEIRVRRQRAALPPPPIPGNALGAPLTLDHEGECPSLMALVARAMAAGIPQRVKLR